MKCSRTHSDGLERRATERVKVSFGSGVAMTIGGQEFFRMDFVSELLCRTHAVELILAVSTVSGLAPISVPLTWEADMQAAKDIFERLEEGL